MPIYGPRILPYVYKLTHKVTGEFYIGYRESNKHPSSVDLPKYQTSSKVVKAIGFENFDWQIVAEFFDGASAYEYENHQIAEHWNDPLILNRQYKLNSKRHFRFAGKKKPQSAEHVQKRFANRTPQQSWPESQTPEWIAKRTTNKQPYTPQSTDTRIKNPQSKTYLVTWPDGTEQLVTNLNLFCQSNHLNQGCMWMTSKSTTKTHKGFRCDPITS